MIDPQAVHLPDLPPEWAAIPPELLVRLAPSAGYVTPEQRATINRIAAGRWFLVRNDLRARCGSCRQGTIPGAIHDYISSHCVELPFNGLRELTVFLQEYQHGDMILSALQPGTLVPITAAVAQRLNARIRERGGQTIAMQRPIAPGELDGAAIARRLERTVKSLR